MSCNENCFSGAAGSAGVPAPDTVTFQWGTPGTIQVAQRFLTPGFTTLSATVNTQQPVPFDTGIVRRILVIQATPGGASTHTYELFVGGVATGKTVVMSSAATLGTNLTVDLPVVLGNGLTVGVLADVGGNVPNAVVIVLIERT